MNGDLACSIPSRGAADPTAVQLCDYVELDANGGLVQQWESAKSFDEAIRVMGLLDVHKAMPAELLARIEQAY